MWTYGERLLPTGAHDGGSDDGDVELVLLLLHHELCQGFGVGVCVGPVADEPRCDVTHDAIIHPPADTQRISCDKLTQRREDVWKIFVTSSRRPMSKLMTLLPSLHPLCICHISV